MSKLPAGPANLSCHSEGNGLGSLRFVSRYSYMCLLMAQGCKEMIPFTLRICLVMYGQITLVSGTLSCSVKYTPYPCDRAGHLPN